MKFIEMNRKLKEGIKNLYNIKGEDYFLVKQAITNLKSFLIKDLEEFNYSKIEDAKLSNNELQAEIETLPIGNDYKLLVIENPTNDNIKMLNTYNFSDISTIVVCINASNLKEAEEIDCSKLDRTDLTKYILNYLSKFKLSIKEQALDYLIDATNSNMSNIVNELNKLTSFVDEGGVIDMEIVTNLVANASEYAIYTLTNAIDNKDFTRFQKILNEISQNQSIAEIYAYMGKYFKRMQYIALNKNDEELSSILNIKPYAIKMARQYVQKNGIKFYINLYEKYVDLDYKVKSGKISVKNALYELVF